MSEFLQCIACKEQYPITEVRYHCTCGSLLAVERPAGAFAKLTPASLKERTSSQDPLDQSGVWKYREAILNLEPKHVVTHPEGRTRLYQRPSLASYAGVATLALKHEGENPTGSFKDRGMTVAVSQAKRLGLTAVACASTGNTSAALAAYAAQAGMRALVFIPAGKIATGKLAQSLGYGARCLAVRGDFDQAMKLVQEAAKALGIYLVNSINPFRLEGQKSIVFEMLEQRAYVAPDWLVVPAGNLGNTSAFGKAFVEAQAAGWITKLPRIAAIQAEGANPFYLSFKGGFKKAHQVKAETVATAIRIGDPVNYAKARQVIEATRGVVHQVNDQDIMLAKAEIDRAGIGCEPASAATLAGIRQLVKSGIIARDADVVGILTGHMLKDPEAALTAAGGAQGVTEIEPTLKAVEAELKSWR